MTDSYDQKITKSADGSLDLYFGPKPPAGKDANWVHTAPDPPWLTLFRSTVRRSRLENTWRLIDIDTSQTDSDRAGRFASIYTPEREMRGDCSHDA